MPNSSAISQASDSIRADSVRASPSVAHHPRTTSPSASTTLCRSSTALMSSGERPSSSRSRAYSRTYRPMPAMPAAAAAATRSSNAPNRGLLKCDQTRSGKASWRASIVWSHALDAMVGHLRPTDPPTQLWIGLEHVSLDPGATDGEEADLAVGREHPDVPLAVLLVERSREGMAETEHVSRPPPPTGRADGGASAPSTPGSWRASPPAWSSFRDLSAPSAC